MPFPKTSFEDTLVRSVIDTGKCASCGACVVTCPFSCLELVDEKPLLVKKCQVCGICAQICPRYEWSWHKAEHFVFSREKRIDEEFGVYRDIAVAQSTENSVLEVCQDGGVVTGILLYAFREGLIDAAVVTGTSNDKPFLPLPKLATNLAEILKCAGTKYCYSRSVLALSEVIKQKKEKVAFVGTPCQIHAVRKMQMAGLKKHTFPIKYLIGLMCSECFTYKGLMEDYVHSKLGVNLNNVKKMNIKGKLLITTESEVKAVPLAEVKPYARGSCSFCDDFSSELADISAGGLGLDAWTFTVIRTETGEELFSSAKNAGAIKTRDAKQEINALNLLCKLSKKKRQVSPKR
ncbi:Coenzyme F420 hydrogenase/dehydrogenase, beta subunit C-terminal domain [Candidatus Bathyarchaeota archaeon]|nr:Coenzyme F420 hydrogenase/dehydrogenase, beta subunit C-terminal domain [Candidatus Bathyarchaeota archaeon]